jgi:hypothetical protein
MATVSHVAQATSMGIHIATVPRGVSDVVNPRRPRVVTWLVSHVAQWQRGQRGHVKCAFHNTLYHAVSKSLISVECYTFMSLNLHMLSS